jgi:hypothetical protein
MSRITVTLQADEHEALRELSERERRNPRDQAALLIRENLQRLGLLAAESQPALNGQPQQAQSEIVQ